MSAEVKCDYCGERAPMTLAGRDYMIPSGWRTPMDDDARAVYRASRCAVVCSFACEDNLYRHFKEQRKT